VFFFTEFDCFAANYVIVVEDRPIMSVNIVSQFQRALSELSELLVHFNDLSWLQHSKCCIE